MKDLNNKDSIVKSLDDVSIGFERNGITLSIKNIYNKKLPVLSIHFKGEDDEYVLAFFKTQQEAKWFTEVFEEFMKGY